MDTIKKQIVRGFANALNSKALKGNKVIIATALGLISGRLCDPEIITTEVSGASVMAAMSSQIVNDYGVENIDGNDGFLLLTDAIIRTSAGIEMQVANLVVFYDQIIGVSFGSIL